MTTAIAPTFDTAVTPQAPPRKIEASYSLGGRYESTECKVSEAFETASGEGWDGYDGVPVSLETLGYARRFVWALPSSVPMPEVVVEPDGEISFEWSDSPKWVFSVSIGPRGELAYAGLFGRKKTYGTDQFVDEIPTTILRSLGRYLRKVP
jgi:hypothetical protein